MAKKKQLVTKDSKASLSNILNEMFYEENMTLQELRFFLVYLSRINPNEPDKTVVSFSLDEYSELLGVELNEQRMKAVTRKLMRYVISIRPKVLEPGIRQHIMNRQLFAKSDLRQRESDGKWILTFACHEDIKEHLFDLKSEFTSLEVWNIVNLGNFQDARMYMLLCQYRTVGNRTIDLDELKKMLGIDPKSYPEFKEFSRTVLKKCQKSLKERTDLCFDFRAVGRPAKAVYFAIRNNDEYATPKFLEKELEGQQAIPGVIDAEEFYVAPNEPLSAEQAAKEKFEEHLRWLSQAVNDEFTMDEVQIFHDLALKHCPMGGEEEFDYIRNKYNLLRSAESKNKIRTSRSGWLKGAIGQDWK